MSLYIKWGGLALMLIAALTVSKGYREYITRRISEQESFISLLSHIEGQISRYLKPLTEALHGFSDENLDRIGFLREVSAGESLCSAFEKASPHLAMGETAKELLKKLFAGLGGGYKEEVLADIREASSQLEKILADEKEALPKNEKVASAVTVAVALGIFILLV